MVKQAITAQFTEPDDFLAELERDHDRVERMIVRLTKLSRLDAGAALTHVEIEATAIVEGRLVCLSVYCGALWGIEGQDEPVRARTQELCDRLHGRLSGMGFEVRAGRWMAE